MYNGIVLSYVKCLIFGNPSWGSYLTLACMSVVKLLHESYCETKLQRNYEQLQDKDKGGYHHQSVVYLF
jgi:hypothetical protein